MVCYPSYLFIVVVVVCVACVRSGPITPRTSTPSSDEDVYDDEQVADLWLQLCGWKEKDSRMMMMHEKQQLAATLRNSLGVLDGHLGSVSCEEPPPPPPPSSPPPPRSRQSSRKVEPPVQNQVIFIQIPDPSQALIDLYMQQEQRKQPRVVVYVLPPEEKHVFNFVDMRDHKSSSPTVHFLSNFGNGIDGRRSRSNVDLSQQQQRVSRGVAQSTDLEEHDEKFEMIPATYMGGYSYFV